MYGPHEFPKPLWGGITWICDHFHIGFGTGIQFNGQRQGLGVADRVTAVEMSERGLEKLLCKPCYGLGFILFEGTIYLYGSPLSRQHVPIPQHHLPAAIGNTTTFV